MLAIAIAMWALSRYFPIVRFIPASWRRVGWYLITIALIALVAAFIQFLQARTSVNPHRPEMTTTLVTSGLYAWTRNPMYLGLSILLLGWAIKLGTLSALLGPLFFVPLIQYIQINPEEQALQMQFGRNYEQYCNRVNRWLGRRQGA